MQWEIEVGKIHDFMHTELLDLSSLSQVLVIN